jgi:hypothetical protein
MSPPSERIHALVSGYAAADRASRLLAVFQTYTDDSGRGDRNVFLLAGFVSTVPRWADFSDEWKSALGRLQYFKAKEAAALRGQFSRVSPCDRDRLVVQLCKIIIKHIIYGVRGYIDVRAWEKIALGKYDKALDFPYTFLVNDIICTVMDEQYRRGLRGQVDFVFDTQSRREFQNVLEGWNIAKRYHMLRPNELMPAHHRRRMGQPPYMLDDKITMPLQATDLLAWTSYRSASDGFVGKSTPLVDIIASEFSDHPIMTQFVDKRSIIEYFDKIQSLGVNGSLYRSQFRPSPRQRRRMDEH